jgi:UDP-N-acetylmuramoylalanine--D-glutamate ligase
VKERALVPDWLSDADRSARWDELDVCVAGLGVSGFAAADALLRMGSSVTVVDARGADLVGERAQVLELLGAQVRLGDDAADALPGSAQLVVTSPGWRPTAPLLLAARADAVPVWGEVELAWRLRPLHDPAPWLVVTGTNGKTTTVRMLSAMLTAAGHRAVAAGNVGTPLVEVVLAEPAYDVVAVEVSSFQLHWTSSMRPLASAVLNVAPDHLDWHGSLQAYTQDKGRAYANTEVACVYNVADPVTEQLVRDADVVLGCRAVGFTLGAPAVGMLGVVEDVLVDRAFVPDRAHAAAELASVHDVVPFAPHNVANALAAAALARAFGVPPAAVRDGLVAFTPDGHRIAAVAEVDGVKYVDDSKATNPHAAAASLAAYDRVVWVAGGLAKGADFDDLVRHAAPRLRAVVLLGRDRAVIAEAVARHAPDVPVVEVVSNETGVMDEVVRAAAAMAVRGDTVLLAPACASMDLFRDYAARGDAFAEAVGRLPGGSRR